MYFNRPGIEATNHLICNSPHCLSLQWLTYTNHARRGVTKSSITKLGNNTNDLYAAEQDYHL